jgi:hypothetical protein
LSPLPCDMEAGDPSLPLPLVGPVSSHWALLLPEPSLRFSSELTGGPKLRARACRGESRGPVPETQEKITKPRQRRRSTDCTIDMRFWKTTSSARMLSLVLMARISWRDSSRWLSSEMIVDCQISSYCCLKPPSSANTVLFNMSRKAVVFWSCFFSTLVNASRRILDCSSIYFRDRVEFASRSRRRRETALKKLSWIVGRAEVDDEVLVVLFFWELVEF